MRILGKIKTGYFKTHVERKLGFLVYFRLHDRQDNAFNKAIVMAFEKIPRKLKKSFTVDNGKDFPAHKQLVSETSITFRYD